MVKFPGLSPFNGKSTKGRSPTRPGGSNPAGSAAATRRNFLQDERGAIAVMFALSLSTVCLGLTAFVIDYGYVYSVKAQLVATTDAAALAAATSLADSTVAVSRATAVAELNMPSASHGTVVSSANVVLGNWDTSAKTFSSGGSSVNAVKVTAYRTASNGNEVHLFFGSLFGISSLSVTETAIAYSPGSGEVCILALDSSASDAASTSGNATVNIENCSVMANSTASDAISVGGASSLAVDCVFTAGGVSGTPTMNKCASVNEGVSTVSDPYASLVIPSVSTCDVSGNYNTQDGSLFDTNGDGYIKVCGSLTIKGAFTLQDGVTYIIEDAFAMNAGATASATSVTFIAQDKVTINGGASFSISAPTSDQQFTGQSGMVLIQDPSTSTSSSNDVKLNGGSNMEFTGAIYIPNNDLTFTGGTYGNGCTQIVALTVSFGSDAVIENNCSSLGVTVINISGIYSLVQ